MCIAKVSLLLKRRFAQKLVQSHGQSASVFTLIEALPKNLFKIIAEEFKKSIFA